MNLVHKIMGSWFAYGRTRILGPFRFEKQAWNALKNEGEL